MSYFIYCYAECHNAECHYAECRYAEFHYAECHYAECRGAYKTWMKIHTNDKHASLFAHNASGGKIKKVL